MGLVQDDIVSLRYVLVVLCPEYAGFIWERGWKEQGRSCLCLGILFIIECTRSPEEDYKETRLLNVLFQP